MNVKIEESWKNILNAEFDKEYFVKLVQFVKQEYSSNVIYPPGNKIFAAFDYCKFDDLKVVIIGQDPYHGEGQANGLCFSVNDGIAVPPSLQNIFKEINRDLNIPIPKSGNLERWAKQGVLLLNATLTVRANLAGSHQNKGWEQFTDSVIAEIAKRKMNIVYLLWGSYAQKKASFINSNENLILKSVHPSPLSAHRGFIGCNHFSETNKYLKHHQFSEINW